MDYVELNVRVTDPELAEILTAELAELPYESFQTEGEVLKAYIPRERLADCMQQTDDLLARYGIADRRYIAIESQNWNALWEQNFTPVDVDGRILIRAPFHASQPGYELEVVVMPRMAFGSGHHATTCLVASALCDLSLTGKRGLDMGCGTGVLAIVAAKRGAATVDAVDIDEWAEANCRENAAANGLAERIAPMLGDVSRIAGRKYDFIAANTFPTRRRRRQAWSSSLTAGQFSLMTRSRKTPRTTPPTSASAAKTWFPAATLSSAPMWSTPAQMTLTSAFA